MRRIRAETQDKRMEIEAVALVVVVVVVVVVVRRRSTTGLMWLGWCDGM